MQITVLGSGTSQGVPVIACDCEVCQSIDTKDYRRRCSILVEDKNTTLVIDTGPDFREQMLRAKVKDLDAVVFTHEHKDHVAGMDDIRAFNYQRKGKKMDVFATEQVQKALHREFPYVFAKDKYPGVPEVALNTIDKKDFWIKDIKVTPIDLLHFKLPVKGFRIGKFAYVTDANYIAESEKLKLKNLDILILNALRKEPHISHFNLEEAIELVNELKPQKTYLTHISHLMGKHKNIESQLPDNIYLAYDGQVLKIE